MTNSIKVMVESVNMLIPVLCYQEIEDYHWILYRKNTIIWSSRAFPIRTFNICWCRTSESRPSASDRSAVLQHFILFFLCAYPSCWDGSSIFTHVRVSVAGSPCFRVLCQEFDTEWTAANRGRNKVMIDLPQNAGVPVVVDIFSVFVQRQWELPGRQ